MVVDVSFGYDLETSGETLEKTVNKKSAENQSMVERPFHVYLDDFTVEVIAEDATCAIRQAEEHLNANDIQRDEYMCTLPGIAVSFQPKDLQAEKGKAFCKKASGPKTHNKSRTVEPRKLDQEGMFEVAGYSPPINTTRVTNGIVQQVVVINEVLSPKPSFVVS